MAFNGRNNRLGQYKPVRSQNPLGGRSFLTDPWVQLLRVANYSGTSCAFLRLTLAPSPRLRHTSSQWERGFGGEGFCHYIQQSSVIARFRREPSKRPYPLISTKNRPIPVHFAFLDFTRCLLRQSRSHAELLFTFWAGRTLEIQTLGRGQSRGSDFQAQLWSWYTQYICCFGGYSQPRSVRHLFLFIREGFLMAKPPAVRFFGSSSLSSCCRVRCVLSAAMSLTGRRLARDSLAISALCS